MSIERVAVPTDEEWHEARHHDVTASVAGCLLGVHEYQSAFGLWALKTGAIVEDPEETPPMKRGRHLEVVAVNLLREQHPDWQIIHNSGPDRVYLRDPDVRLGATIDVFANDPARGPGVVQVKTVEGGVYRRKWRDPESGDVTPPLWIAVQGIVEAHLAEVEWVDVAPLVVGFGLDMPLIPVPLHAGIIDRVRAEVADFWRMIDEGRAPDPDWKRDGRLIEALYRPTGEIIDLSAENDLPELADEKDRLSGERSAADTRLKEIKTQFLAKLGGASQARIADGRLITASRVNRKAYEVAAHSYVNVTVKKPRTMENAE